MKRIAGGAALFFVSWMLATVVALIGIEVAAGAGVTIPDGQPRGLVILLLTVAFFFAIRGARATSRAPAVPPAADPQETTGGR